MVSQCGEVALAFNGEIYNYGELRAELEASGHVFRSESDTEVVLRAYEQYGKMFVKRLNGMFALAVADLRVRELVLVRDRLGQKPLYILQRGQGLAFASEMKAFTTLPGVRLQLSARSLREYLTLGFVNPPNTLVAGVGKLAPAEMLTFSRDGVVRQGYWELEGEAVTRRDEVSNREAAIAATRRRVTDSVRRHMVSDVPVGSFLSSGVDSSIVTALMARESKHTPLAVTVANPELPHLDESADALAVAKRIGAESHLIEIGQRDVLEHLDRLVFHMDEPSSDPACVNTYFASSRIRQAGIKVALVGEGADEAFMGYPTYDRHLKYAAVLRALGRLPWVVKMPLKATSGYLLDVINKGAHKDLIHRALDGRPLFITQHAMFGEAQIAERLSPGLDSGWAPDELVSRLNGLLTEALGEEAGYLPQIAYNEMRTRLPELLLMRVDKLSMAHSLEVRSPFLDHELVASSLSMPAEWHREMGGKGVLKRAFEDILMPRQMGAKKRGFSTPIAEWLRGELGQHLYDRAIGGRLCRSGTISPEGIHDIMRAHRNGAKGLHAKMWALFMLTEWAERCDVDPI
jgi:asparagine synthase (glutamine-hydrolysing)